MLSIKNLRTQSKGEANLLLIIVATGFASALVFLLAAAILVNHINSIMYTIKVDMFVINRAAVIALNKDAEGKGLNDISREEYLKFFKEVLRQNYGLDEELKNGNKLIEKIDIIRYDYDTTNEPVIKTEIGVKVSPIVFRKVFKDIFYFRIKQNVKVQKVLK
ncbi:MAG: hypothetical protein ACM3UU_00615 [Ignavibacteriales bacterium]